MPRDIKRAHTALWLSGGGWLIIVLCLAALIALVSVNLEEGEVAGVLGSRQNFPALVTGRIIAGSGVALCFFGMVLGFGSWKHRRGKTAALLGAANVATAAIVAFAAFWINRR